MVLQLGHRLLNRALLSVVYLAHITIMDHRHVDGAGRRFDASHVRADIGRSALGIRLQQGIEAKLGRCTRCMTISAVSFIVAWALVVALAQLRPAPVVLLAAATVVAVLFSGVALAHTLAYAMHRRGGVGAARAMPAAGTTPQRRGCGCGSNRA